MGTFGAYIFDATGLSFFWEVWVTSYLCLLLTVFLVSLILFLGVVILGFIVGSYLTRVDFTIVVLNYFLAKFYLFLTTAPVAFFLIFL